MGNWSCDLVSALNAVELAILFVTSALATGVVALLLRIAVEAVTPPTKVVSVCFKASRRDTTTTFDDEEDESLVDDDTTAFLGLLHSLRILLDQPREKFGRLPTIKRKRALTTSFIVNEPKPNESYRNCLFLSCFGYRSMLFRVEHRLDDCQLILDAFL